MSDAAINDFGEEASAPVPSGWRRAVIAFTVLGAAGFAFGRIVFRLDSITVPMSLVMMSSLAPMLALMGFGLWWFLFGDFSRLTRVLSIFGTVVAAVAVMLLAQGSFGPPPQGLKMFAFLWGVPLAAAITGLVLAAVPALRGLPVVLVGAAAVSPWLLLRTEGVTGAFDLDVAWRWSTPRTVAAEQQLADRANVTAATTSAAVTATEADWPGFRGAERTGVAPLAAYQGWDGSAPKERWRKDPVGPAWSSVCVAGGFVFTQEQRGESESVVCYRADDGKEVWARGDTGKHTDWASGSGPRATPTFANGKVFALNASGTVLAINAASGELLWRADLKERFGATKPQFGWSGSPLVVGDLVFVNPSSLTAPRLVALSVANGETKWKAEGTGTDSYSSPQLATLAGAQQVLIFNGDGLFGHDPATGAELWHYEWKSKPNEPATIQPLLLPGDLIVIGGGVKGLGTRSLKVQHEGGTWSVAEKWTTTKFTPVFNDVVKSGDNLFGLDTGRLVCLDLKTGAVRWREGNYGSGQLLLVGDKLLIASETGRLACVAAKADEFEELWAVTAVKGKTWNHPAVAGGRIYFRNTTEMAAYDLPGYTGKK